MSFRRTLEEAIVFGRLSALCVLATMLPIQSAGASDSEVIDIGSGVAMDINNRGEVVGGLRTPFELHAFVWSEETGTIYLENNDASVALAINDAGDVVGVVLDEDVVWRPFLWTKQGGWRDLELPCGSVSNLDINNRNEIVGSCHTVEGEWIGFRWRERTGFEHLSGPAVAINNRGGVLSRNRIVYGEGRTEGPIRAGWKTHTHNLNDTGHVVGYRENDEWSPTLDAFVWSEREGSTFLGRLGQHDIPLGINNRGDVVGWSDWRPFLWIEEDGFVLLGEPVGGATAINERREITGHLNGRAVIWRFYGARDES